MPEEVTANADSRSSPEAGGTTVSHVLGEIAWLMTQSSLHKDLPVEALEWLAMPAVIHRQFYIFRDGGKPVGVALWASCDPGAEAKLDRGMIEPANRLTLEEWNSGDRIWLVDLIAPFADQSNRHREIMLADLISGPLAGKPFKFHQTDPATGNRTVGTVAADAGMRLKQAVEAHLSEATEKQDAAASTAAKRDSEG